MKLVFVIGSLHIGGAEKVMVELTSSLVERNHEIYLIYNFKNRDFNLNENVKQIDFCSIEYNTFEGNIIERIYKKAANRVRDYNFFKQFIKNENPDVVISFMQNRAEILYFACKGRVPLVFSEHSSMLRKPSSILGRFVRGYILPRSSAVTVLTNFDAAYMYDKLPNVFVMPNALNFDAITSEEYDNIFNERKNLLACGRLSYIKGIDNLIEVFSRLPERYNDWHLDIIGKDEPGGGYLKLLEELVSEKGLEDRVHFLGFHSDVQSIMKKHSIYCLTSRSEGFSLTLTEAMASGMATISYELTGPQEITINGIDGILIENQNIERFVEGLKILMDDKDLRYRLGIRAIEDVKRFNKTVVVARWERLLSNLIEN